MVPGRQIAADQRGVVDVDDPDDIARNDPGPGSTPVACQAVENDDAGTERLYNPFAHGTRIDPATGTVPPNEPPPETVRLKIRPPTPPSAARSRRYPTPSFRDWNTLPSGKIAGADDPGSVSPEFSCAQSAGARWPRTSSSGESSITASP